MMAPFFELQLNKTVMFWLVLSLEYIFDRFFAIRKELDKILSAENQTDIPICPLLTLVYFSAVTKNALKPALAFSSQ